MRIDKEIAKNINYYLDNKGVIDHEGKSLLDKYNRYRKHILEQRYFKHFYNGKVPYPIPTKINPDKEVLIISGKSKKILICKLIQVTPKGYNFIEEDGTKVLSIGRHFYKNKDEQKYNIPPIFIVIQ